jgi:hypothetical protein
MATTVPIIQGEVTLDIRSFQQSLQQMQQDVKNAVSVLQSALASVGLGTAPRLDAASASATKAASAFRAATGDVKALGDRLSTAGTKLSSFGSGIDSFLSNAGKEIDSFISDLGNITKDLPATATADISNLFTNIGSAIETGISTAETTLSSDWAAFTAQLGDDFSTLGTAVQTEIDQWGSTFSALGTTAHETITSTLAAFQLAWGQLSSEIGTAFSIAGTTLHGDIEAWGLALSELGAKAQETLQGAWMAIQTRWDQLTADVGGLFMALGILISTDIAGFGATLATLGTTAETSLQTAWQAIQERWSRLSTDVAGIFAALGLALQGDIATIGATVTTLGVTVQHALDAAWTTASARFNQWKGDAATATTDILTAITTAIAGFTQPIIQAFTTALDAVTLFFQQHDPFAGIISFVQQRVSQLQGLIGQVQTLAGQTSPATAMTGQQLWMSQSGQNAEAWNALAHTEAGQQTQQLFVNQANANAGSSVGGGMSTSADSLIAAADAITEGYAGYCESYVEQVIADASGQPYKNMGGSATDAYANRIAAGALHGTGTPPAGSLVYFRYIDPKTGQDDGHVGIATGGENFRSALDDGIRTTSIAAYVQTNAGQSAAYRGWVMPAYASGISSTPAASYALVGEDGPEVVHLPASSAVTPTHRVAGLLNNSINDSLSIVSTITSQLSQAINQGLAALNATLAQAARQPVQHNKTTVITIDSMNLSSDGDVEAAIQQLRYMGGA